jgi:hypothetical protein
VDLDVLIVGIPIVVVLALATVGIVAFLKPELFRRHFWVSLSKDRDDVIVSGHEP